MYSHRTNHDRYPEWQAHYRQYRPPMLIVCGKNDTSFPVVAARSYLRDVPDAELHLFETGRFALEKTATRLVL